jgi:glycerol-3-phosphate dehydrogenase
MPPIGEAQERAYRRPGRIVCHCERVTAGEIDAALDAVVPARSLDGLRRRTRCLQGRCQGFYCLAEVAGMLARKTSRSIDDVLGLT